jgi:murein L,D-transpeptidase YafK
MNTSWKFLTILVLFGAFASPLYSVTKPSANVKADRIVVIKCKRQMQLLHNGSILKTYRIALGGEPVGRKEQQGDHRTPEGTYTIIGRNPNSKYHRALRVSYPNEEDRARAANRGVSPGGDIMIHGLPNGYGWVGSGHIAKDWTEGCIAVTDQEIEEIWSLVADGTPVEIRP